MKENTIVGAALFDYGICSNTSSPNLGKYFVNTLSSKCLQVRQGPNMNKPAKVNALAFFFCAADKKQIKMGIDPVSANSFLIEKQGSSENTSFKVMMTYERQAKKMSIVANREDDKIYGIAIGALVHGAPEFQSMYGTYRNILADELANHSLNMCFDAFYYEAKNTSDFIDTKVEVKIDPVAVDIAFNRAGSFEKIKVPEEMKDFLAEEYFPSVCEQAATSTAPTPAAPENDELKSFMEDCLNKKYRQFDVFFKDVGRIPPVSILKNYAPSFEFKRNLIRMYQVFCEAFALKKDGSMDPNKTQKRYASEMSLVMNALFFGPPGTGKSHMCTAIGAALGVPVYQFTVTGGFEEGNFDKMPVFRDAGIQMASQPFRDGFENGGIIVVDEVNLGKSDILMYLSGALERPYLLGQGTEDQIRRHSATIIVGTCNPGVNGTKRQNVAFLNRFSFWTEFKASDRDRLFRELCSKKRDMNLDASENRKYVDKMLDVYEDIVNGLKNKMQETEGLTQVLSLRNLSGCCDNFFNFGFTLRDSIEDSILSPILYTITENADQDTLDEFQENVYRSVKIMMKDSIYGKCYTGTGA